MYDYNDFSPELGFYDELDKKNDKKELPSADEAYTPRIDIEYTPPKRDTHTRRAKERRKRAKTLAASITAGTEKLTVDVDKVKESTSDSLAGLWTQVRDFFTSATFRVLSGVLLLGLSAYLCVAIISFVTEGFADHSEVAGYAVGNAKNIHNLGGEGGARLSELLVNDAFGVSSLVIAFWLMMVGLKLVTNSRLGKFKTVNFTSKCIVALLTFSLIVGLLTIGIDTSFNLGGNYGRFVNQEIIDFIGWIGAAILSIFMLSLFVGICMSDVVKWFVKKKHERDARRAAELEAEEEELRKKREFEDSIRREAIENGLAGETPMPAFETSGSQEASNVNFHDETDIERAGDNVAGSPVEEDLTYVYDDKSDISQPGKDDAAYEEFPADENTGEGQEMIVNVNHIDTVGEDKADSEADARRTVKTESKRQQYHFPPVALLDEPTGTIAVDKQEQLENQAKIRNTLLNFKIPITRIDATVGPTVTLYEIVPEDGIKVSRITSLTDNIALNLSAKGVRMISMEGRGTIGIEVANKKPQMVSLRTLLTSRKSLECTYALPLALGSTIANEVYIADLSKMPHLLVAGATGTGKSVGLNVIITSLLYRKHPDELKFILVDPKMVELSMYSPIEKHYLARIPGEESSIITDMTRVMPVLNSLVQEMEDRYRKLQYARCRELKAYNQKFKEGKLNPEDGHKYLPYIVLVVDEYADLLMNVGKEVEKPIARLAQMARAVGIHLIITTQRPSTDVVTGMIKANFPARIAFKVSSGVDSKTILNTTSAHQLIGNGDMLISNNSDLVRIQCAYISTHEVEDICNFISQQPIPDAYVLPEPPRDNDDEDGLNDSGTLSLDPLFHEVARLVGNSTTFSTSSLQRRYSIGYNRAGKIMDQLEKYGIVDAAQGGKPRKVLLSSLEIENILDSLERNEKI